MGKVDIIREKPTLLTVYEGGKEPVAKPEGKVPSGPDWLRELEYGDRFVCHVKHSAGIFLEQYGIAFVIPECILLGKSNGMGMQLDWVDSMKFSQQYKLVALLPKPDEETGTNNDGDLSGSADGKDHDGHEGSS